MQGIASVHLPTGAGKEKINQLLVELISFVSNKINRLSFSQINS
jgi:hypothetical protein